MVKRGFTIVELIIVITIMGILLVLGVVNLNGSQADARDAERKSDVETIATALESVYSGYTSANGSQKAGQYPSTADLLPNPTNILKDIDPKALQPPSTSAVSALITATTTSTITPVATLSKDKYIYQPLYYNSTTSTWYICNLTQECRKFNIYCVLENGSLCPLITSKHQ